MFENNKVRIGPTGAQKERFLMPGKGETLHQGKKEELPEYFSNLGITAYEFPGGRLAKFSDSPTYEQFRSNAIKFDVAISFHAPYYISLTSDDPEIYNKSIERIANSYVWASYLNAKRIVVHPGSYGHFKKKAQTSDLSDFMGKNTKSPSNNLISKIVDGILLGIEMANIQFPTLKDKFKDICICPETMGKQGQLGTTAEVIQICKEIGIDKARPCVDFGHLYARNVGKLDGLNLYEKTFEHIEQELGSDVVKYLHIHYSKIEFTPKGEKMHHPNATEIWGPKIEPLLSYIKEQNFYPIIINESPDLEPDAVELIHKWNLIKI